MPAVLHALQIANEQIGIVRSAQTLPRVTPEGRVRLTGLRLAEENKRHITEFCESGAKAVAEEATTRRIEPDFFAAHCIDDLRRHDDGWLSQQGRLTHPMLLDKGDTLDRPFSWEDALDQSPN